ncbi:MAG: tRNA 2-thiouridine(34) synthase MnmA [Alphaproteobacteria bacterium]|nr:tRNA 2-thiouridine(34) synthase MnmA [Alphaproteobacteria bacterium]
MNSLGFNKEPKDTRVVVAMSGGVDSSVVAAMLKDQGYDVVGITLQLYDHGAATQSSCDVTQPVQSRSKTCCAGADIYDAKTVAAKINIPHYVLDYESAFRQSVMDDFADSYLKGETPIPCVRCNQKVKFRDLLIAAKDLGADCLATGHYVQRIVTPNGSELTRAADANRDQSYFLFATTQEQLDYLRFPLGHLPTKAETRALAAKYELVVAEKPDSQDICFVPQGKYVDVVAKMRPGAIEPGDIVLADGTVLGRHEGIIHYTIGQRKGLNLQQRSGENREPLFVIGLNAAKKQVIVGNHHALAVTAIDLKETNWLATTPSQNLLVRYRSSMEPVPAQIIFNDNGSAKIEFNDPQFGVAPGQACVVYDGNRVMGGGWIAKTHAMVNPNGPKPANTLLSERETGVFATA